jgi:hypothetical protein
MASLIHDQIKDFLVLVVEAIGNMMCFLNNMTNFLDAKTKIPDFGTQLQAYSSVHLLFANISKLNQSTDGFQRVTDAMAIVDKLANMKKHLGAQCESEELLFKKIFSLEEKNRLRQIIVEELGESDAGMLISHMVEQAYSELHVHYGEDMRETGEEEQRRLSRVRNQRNLHHGAFLHGDRFHDVFGTSTGEAADELVAIAWLSTLCLAIAPRKYLSA